MRINKLKNKIGLCAAKGCFRPMSVEIKVYEDDHSQWGVSKLKNRFFICHKCAEEAILWRK